jgi:hypothetical protein
MCFLSKLALYSPIFASYNHYKNENLSTKYKRAPYFRKNPVYVQCVLFQFLFCRTRPYKCSQCPKRYKTPGGLQNHVQQTHRQGGGKLSGPGATSLVPVSPSAVTNADRQAAQSSTAALVGQSPAITATTLIAQSSAGSTPGRSTSSTQQIQTAPPPVAGGHQYHQLVCELFEITQCASYCALDLLSRSNSHS